MEMIDKTVFQGFRSSLKESSKQDAQKKDGVVIQEACYMTENMFEVIKLDDYNNSQYKNECFASESLCGCDALFCHNSMYYLLEFKNGRIGPKEAKMVLEKMYASFIVACDKLQISIDEARNKFIFTVVYNYNKNYQKVSDDNSYYIEKGGRRSCYECSISPDSQKIRDAIKRRHSSLVKNINSYKFGLYKLEKSLFKEVVAISERSLDNYLIEEGFKRNEKEELIPIT